MQLVPAGVQLSFDVTFESADLDVGMVVYDTTGVSPIQVMAPTAMHWVYGNTYVGKFIPSAQKNYLVVKSVYTDGTLTDLDPDYSAGSETIVAEELGSFGQINNGCSIVGIVDTDPEIVGIVEC